MTGHKGLEHGGRLAEAARQWGIPRDQWLDLSTGINPIGWPVPTIPSHLWQRLPEDDDGLDDIIRHWCGAPANAACVPVAGSQAAIQTLPALRRPCRVGVPVPGYREHGHCWASAGHQVVPVSLQQLEAGDDWLAELDALVWINPNNPTATAVSRERLLGWHEQLQGRGGWLVVDEAFVDGRADLSIVPWAGAHGLVVLRSLGKFFGLAGARAGAVLTNPGIAAGLAGRLGPWALSGPARYVMARALEDTAWQSATVERLHHDSERLGGLLRHHGLPENVGTLLYRYLQHPQASEIADALARQGVLVRRFDSPPALRFGLPGHEADWQRLDHALGHCQMSLTKG